MARKFQNRLLGTIILVTLSVIVLSALLDGKKKHYEDKFDAISLVSKPDDSTEAKSLSTAKPEVKLEASLTEEAYVVQLGALKNSSKVNEIVAKLCLSGYRAYTVPLTPVAGEITRIYVGLDTSKQKLQSTLGELQQLSGLTGQVRKYSAH